MKYSKRTIYIFFLLVFFGCASRSPLSNRYISKNKNIQHLIKLGKSHWDRRVDPKDARLANHFLSKAIELDPYNFETIALYSRSCYFLGRFIEKSPAAKDSLYFEGFTKGWDFITSSPSFKLGFSPEDQDSVSRIMTGVENLSGDLLPVAYWWAENYTSYLLTKPALQRIERRDVLETVLHRLLSINPEYYFHGVNRIFGSFYAKLPGIELSQSENNFEKSISGDPDFLNSYVARSQYLFTKKGDKDSFIKDLQYVLNSDPTKLPEASPENLFEQEIAKDLLKKKDSLFE